MLTASFKILFRDKHLSRDKLHYIMKYESVITILLQNFLLCILNRLLLSEHIYSELVFAYTVVFTRIRPFLQNYFILKVLISTSEEFEVFEQEPLVLLAWPFNKPLTFFCFKAEKSSDISFHSIIGFLGYIQNTFTGIFCLKRKQQACFIRIQMFKGNENETVHFAKGLL